MFAWSSCSSALELSPVEIPVAADQGLIQRRCCPVPVSPRCVATSPWIRLMRATPGKMSTCALQRTAKNPSEKTGTRKLRFMPT